MNAKKTNLPPQQENEFFEDVEENLMENILQEERNILETETKSAAESADPVCYRRAPIRTWFCTFMIMNLPIIGWIYLLILALKKNGDQRKDFARAYLVYKLVFLIVALAILALFLYIGLELADNLLQYMEML